MGGGDAAPLRRPVRSMPAGLRSHDGAPALLMVAAQPPQLVGVDGAPPAPADEVHRLRRRKALLDEGNGDQHRCAAKAGHAVDANASIRRVLAHRLHHREPGLHDVARRRRTVREGEVSHLDAHLLESAGGVGRVTDAHNVHHVVLLELADVHGEVVVVRRVEDEEALVLVLHERRWVREAGHCCQFLCSGRAEVWCGSFGQEQRQLGTSRQPTALQLHP
mmetsp:Transcript_789/g.2865  ORF Transcript_789/g.2865 Transcript_789/m.2865 type:complete len:220 (+) Transcript_789:60-719(+)